MDLPGGDWRRIREAGVAGAMPWLWRAPAESLRRATIEGDTVFDFGRGGGPISDSDKGSGEIELLSDPSRLIGSCSALVLARGESDRELCSSSIRSLTSFGGAMAVFSFGFRRACAPASGDCRALDGAAAAFFPRVFRGCPGCGIADSPSMSTSTSAGDVDALLDGGWCWCARCPA